MKNPGFRPATAFFLFSFLWIVPAQVPASGYLTTALVRAATDDAPGSEYATIDAYARQTPESQTRSLNTLAQYLTAPAHSDLAKARSVYTWIMAHIRYDEAAGGNGLYNSEIGYAEKVLTSRRAVCTGFALLYKHLLKRAGIRAVTVKGYARTADSEAGQPIAKIDHEWNAVELDGEWYLLDLAWASTTARNDRANEYFFLTDPETFVAGHLPADSRWQLLETPVSKAQFDQFPKLYDAYFRLGFSADFPQSGRLPAGPTVSVTIENGERPVEFMCSVSRVNGATAQPVPVSVVQTGDQYRLTIKLLPTATVSTLYIFAKPKRDGFERVKSFEGIASFRVGGSSASGLRYAAGVW